ncbi:hypothetical protein CVT25_010029 [Psilocybe cyanescens]|uniref:Uncharacterized protein n=1 Tax=Psilocybe cyanescens TaxID=93625 RepID=A0A409X3D0_PSICY|nr:hypothetical protein CVT25_010029 [Psilocybe cyanescens]
MSSISIWMGENEDDGGSWAWSWAWLWAWSWVGIKVGIWVDVDICGASSTTKIQAKNPNGSTILEYLCVTV